MTVLVGPNRIPAKPIVNIVRSYLGQDGDRLSEESSSPSSIALLAERADIRGETLGKILDGRNLTIDFDVADRLLCAMNLTDLWRTDLSDIYNAAFFDEEWKRHRVVSASGAKVCERRGCSERFVPPAKSPWKRFCSNTCRATAWKHERLGLKTVPRGKGRALEALVCRNGHPRTKANTAITSRGTRYCRICHNATSSRWRKDHRERERHVQ